MKKNRTRSMLAGLALAVVFGVVFHVRDSSARAQTATASVQAPTVAVNAPQTQPPAKNEQEDEYDAYRKSAHVVEWGAKLGWNPEQSSIAFVILNFLLLAALVVWVLMKIGLPFMQIDPLPKLLRDRSTSIQKGLADARTATEEARTRLSGVEERLGRLDGEIAAMRAHAEQDSATAEQRIKAAVEDEKKKILAAAEQEIAAATGHAQKQLQQYAAGLAIEQAARKLVVSAETDRLLVQGFARGLTGDEPKKGQN